MSNLVACILRPQLREMRERGERWNSIYAALEERLNRIQGITVPEREPNEEFVASSIQFHVSGLSAEQIQGLADRCTARGVAIKWFGRDEPMGYTSQYHHWEYLTPQELPDTRHMLSTTCDMRIPLALTASECDAIAGILSEEMAAA